MKIVSKVPQLTIVFWLIKIIATTLGETGGDSLSMSLGFGYLWSSLIFLIFFIISVTVQVNSHKFHPFLYWFVVITTTTVGTTIADFVDRSLGIGYTGGTTILVLLLISSLSIWYLTEKNIAVSIINNKQNEWFYWITILFSQTLGTALGDWTADTEGLGFSNGALIFGGLILALTFLYLTTKTSRILLFWLTFILTRPFGAVLGDFLDKPITHGGLGLDRIQISSLLTLIIILLIYIFEIRSNKNSS